MGGGRCLVEVAERHKGQLRGVLSNALAHEAAACGLGLCVFQHVREDTIASLHLLRCAQRLLFTMLVKGVWDPLFTLTGTSWPYTVKLLGTGSGVACSAMAMAYGTGVVGKL
jgi:hypothetical protein